MKKKTINDLPNMRCKALRQALAGEIDEAIRERAALPRGLQDHINGYIKGLETAIKIIQSAETPV